MKNCFLLISALFFCQGYSQTISKYLEDAFAKKWDEKELLHIYNKAILLDSLDCSYLYLQRGKIKYSLKDYDGAILDYNAAIEYDLNCKYNFMHNNLNMETEICRLNELYFERGVVKLEMKNYAEAVLDFSEAIKIKSNYDIA